MPEVRDGGCSLMLIASGFGDIYVEHKIASQLWKGVV